MADFPLVRFTSVSKRFRIQHERPRSFQDLLVRGFRRGADSEEFWALRDVSFTAEPGMSLGIVGANGSGKSTLLKLVTRILTPTSGQIAVRGRISALLELGAGFHPELSGRDNVFLNASILGMRRREVADRFDAIVKFADLERFIDIPVKHYSSGMYARLGFAVAINADPDVLLIDEVLSVGDAAFHSRCLEAIQRFHAQGKTLLLVSHDVGAITSVCSHAIWLDEGTIRREGPPRTVVGAYLAAASGTGIEDAVAVGAPALSPPPQDRRWGSGEAEILGVEIIDGDGNPCAKVRAGDSFGLRIHYRAHEPIDNPIFGIGLVTPQGVSVAGPNTQAGGLTVARIEGDGVVTYVVQSLPLAVGDYRVSASIYDETCTHAYDYQDGWYSFSVMPTDGREEPGLIRLQGRWVHEPAQELGGHPGGTGQDVPGRLVRLRSGGPS
jgi:lipopolysaccharide transport system ATP-binding protein